MTCENFAAVVGNEIMFQQDIIKPNGLVIKVPVSYYYSKWGFMVPTSVNALNVLEYLKGSRELEITTRGLILCYYITHDGTLEEWLTQSENDVIGLTRRTLPWGPEVVHCRSNAGTIEEAWTAALDATDDDLDRALLLVNQTQRNTPARTVKLQIPDIIEELHRRFPHPGRVVRGTPRNS